MGSSRFESSERRVREFGGAREGEREGANEWTEWNSVSERSERNLSEEGLVIERRGVHKVEGEVGGVFIGGDKSGGKEAEGEGDR